MSTVGNWRGPNIVKDGLVLYLDAGSPNSFPLINQSTTWKDISGNGNNGTLTNGPTYNSANGGSIVFDGVNDYVDCGNIIGNFGISNFTISIWVKTTSISKSILAKQVPSGWNGFNLFISSGGKFQIVVDWSTSQQLGYIISNTSINTGSWINCVFVLNGADRTDWKIYINGLSDSFTEFGVDLIGVGINNTTLLTIGKRAYSSGDHLLGNISQTLIYNRALSSSEVLQNFNATRARFGV